MKMSNDPYQRYVVNVSDDHLPIFTGASNFKKSKDAMAVQQDTRAELTELLKRRNELTVSGSILTASQIFSCPRRHMVCINKDIFTAGEFGKLRKADLCV